jgi:PHP family Zn ribbon phosphoesterase
MNDNILDSRIELKKPDVNEILRQGFTPVDMHVHTQYSDAKTKIESILKKAKKKRIGIAVTDHNEINGALKAARMKKGTTVIPGIEVGANDNTHILLYFYNTGELKEFYEKNIRKNLSKLRYFGTKLSTEELMDIITDYNCFSVAAHPCTGSFFGILWNITKNKTEESICRRIDAVEVINGVQNIKQNLRAIKLAYQLKKSFTGGSDSHSLMQLGKVLTYSEADDIEGFIEAIRKKKNFVMGKPINTMTKLPLGPITMYKNFKSLIIKRAPVV